MEPEEGSWRPDDEDPPGGEALPVGEDPQGAEDLAEPPQDPRSRYNEEESNRLVNEALQQEDEFLEYLMSLPVSQAAASAERRRPPAAPAASSSADTEDHTGPRMGLEHLDNLCKLMEQLGDLREQNSKLQKRVQYLEDLKSLQDMHKRLQDSLEFKRRALAGCLVGAEPWISRLVPEPALATWQRGSLRRRRARSRSVGHEEGGPPAGGREKARRGASAKVSRWARVREAVKWEEARLEAGGPAPVGGSPRWRVAPRLCPRHDDCPLECPFHEYSYQLSSTSTSSDSLLDEAALHCGDPGELGAPHRSASATDSTADKLLLECSPQPRRRRSLSPRPEEDAARRSKSLDCEDIQRTLIAEKGNSVSKKPHRTAWGKVKDIIQTRKESVRRREDEGPQRPAGAWEWSESQGQHLPRSPSPPAQPSSPTHPTPPAPGPQAGGPPAAATGRPASASPHQPRHETRSRKDAHAAQCPTAAGAPPRPPSKWTKVKKAFLTSRKEGDGRPATADTRMRLSYSECEAPQHGADHSGGLKRLAPGGQTSAQETPSEPESWTPGTTPSDGRTPRVSHPNPVDVQRNYTKLQQTLSQDFHKKLSEWERMKAGGGEWTAAEKRKRTADGEWPKLKGARAAEDSHTLDFRKKLSDWRGEGARSRPTLAAPGHSAIEHAPPQIRKRLAEWQLWRAAAGKSGHGNVEELHKILPEEFCRKLGEWERIKCAGAVGAADGGGGGTGVGGASRKDASALGRVVRRMRASEVERRPRQQRAEVLRESKQRGKEVQWLQKELQKVEREKLRLEREREKYLEREARLERMRRAIGQCPPGKQEVLIQTSTGFFRFQGISEKFTRKLYEWEKQRGIGPEASTFTLLDPTYIPLSPMTRNTMPDGLNESAATPPPAQPNIIAYQQIVPLPRSRSVGSVADSNPAISGLIQSHSSSLGCIDPKETNCLGEQEVPSRASSEPHLRSEGRGVVAAEDTEDENEEETAALLVEVEDVVEETAAALEHFPKLPSQMPIYSYAPEEVTRLIDSSGSESEKDGKSSGRVNRTSSVRTQSSYELIEENMALINKLKMKEDICRELENEIEDLEEKIQGIAKTHKEELEQLEMIEDTGTSSGRALSSSHTDIVARLKSRVDELERCQEQLKQKEENLQSSFQAHSEQQAALAQNLVGKMKQLHEVSKSVGEQEEWGGGDEERSEELSRELLGATLTGFHSMDLIQNLSTELLQLAEKLEVALADRNQEIRCLRNELQDRQGVSVINDESKDVVAVSEPVQNVAVTEKVLQPSRGTSRPPEKYQMRTLSKPMIPRQSSEELAELPFLLTNKVLELKQELSRLCIPQESAITLPLKEHPCRGKLQKSKKFQGSDEAFGGEVVAGEPSDVVPAQSEVMEQVEEPNGSGGHHHPIVDQSEEPAALREADVAKGVLGERKGSTMEDDLVKPPQSPLLPLDVGRRKSSDCISTPPSERTRSPSVSSMDEWKGSIASWHEAACSVAAVPGSPETKWMVPPGSADEKVESDETESKSDESEMASCTAEDVDEETSLKARHESDTHVAYVDVCEEKTTESPARGTEGSGDIASSSANSSPSTPHALTHPQCCRHSDLATPPLVSMSSSAACNPAANIFVQTTRKIFSPICGEPKGNVISYVVGFPAESEASGGKGAWQKGKLGTERAPPSPRPASLRRTPGTESGRAEDQASDTPPCPHPLPPPLPIMGRRDKGKEAAPSIRLMIAKYDRKDSTSGCSPDAGGLTPGGRSPAWLSPTADRRELFAAGGVKAQMEKYQDEVRKALLGFSNPEVATVQKSASAGIIRSLGVGPNLKPPLHSIAKSSSAGAIKSPGQPKAPLTSGSPAPLFPSREPEAESESVKDTTTPINESIERTLQVLRERLHSSPSPPQSQKFAHLRALRLRKAKEEFMTRGAAVDERVTSSSRFPSLSSVGTGSSSPGLKGGELGHLRHEDSEASGGTKGTQGEWVEGRVIGREQKNTSVRSRHSQISFGSESSYDDSIAVEEGLTKSASSGMIDLYSQKCKQAPLAKVVEKDGGNTDVPSLDSKSKCAPMESEHQSVPGSSKMGILSRFRKVKMRTKKMGAITALCRQSLLVNVHKEGGGREEGDSAAVAPQIQPEGAGPHKTKPVMNYSVPSCRSCPSSPVPSSKKAGNSSCWMHSPKHVFKPQKDCEENFPNAGISFQNKS